MSSKQHNLGRWGEDCAAEYLRSKNYTILERNVRTPYGEIDLIASQETIKVAEHSLPIIVFVEVKTRSSAAYGLPEESITHTKMAHMHESAQAYLQNHPELENDWRIDVISIRCSISGEEPEIIHFENAIS